MTDLPIKIRGLQELDKAFIIDSWVQTSIYANPVYFWVPKHVHRRILGGMVSTLVDFRPELFRVACGEDDEDQIFGWICSHDKVVYFLYVKVDFRDYNVADLLVNTACKTDYWVFVTSYQPSYFCYDRNKEAGYKPELFKELIHETNQAIVRGAKGKLVRTREKD